MGARFPDWKRKVIKFDDFLFVTQHISWFRNLKYFFFSFWVNFLLSVKSTSSSFLLNIDKFFEDFFSVSISIVLSDVSKLYFIQRKKKNTFELCRFILTWRLIIITKVDVYWTMKDCCRNFISGYKKANIIFSKLVETWKQIIY